MRSAERVGPPTRVLIADDSDSLRAVVRITTESQDWIALEATNGTETLALARRHRPDVIILDLDFGGAEPEGLAILAELRSDPETADIPVVVLTASDSGRDRSDTLAGGAAAFLTKPFGPLDLLETLRQVIGDSVAGAGLGLYLVNAGVLTPPQLARALARQRDRERAGERVPLGALLVDQGAISEPDLRRALAQQRDRTTAAAPSAGPVGGSAPVAPAPPVQTRFHRGPGRFPHRAVLVLGAIVGAYLPAFLIVEPALGASAAVIGVVNVALAGVLLGPELGVIAAIAIDLLTFQLWAATGHLPGETIMQIGGNGLGAILLLLLGAGLGAMRVTVDRARGREAVLGRAIMGAPTVESVISAVQAITGGDAAALFRLSPDRSQLALVDATGIEALPPTIEVSASSELAQCLRELAPVIAAGGLATFGEGVRSAAFIPVAQAGGRTVGVLALFDHRPDHFRVWDLRPLLALAVPAAALLAERAPRSAPFVRDEGLG